MKFIKLMLIDAKAVNVDWWKIKFGRSGNVIAWVGTLDRYHAWKYINLRYAKENRNTKWISTEARKNDQGSNHFWQFSRFLARHSEALCQAPAAMQSYWDSASNWKREREWHNCQKLLPNQSLFTAFTVETVPRDGCWFRPPTAHSANAPPAQLHKLGRCG